MKKSLLTAIAIVAAALSAPSSASAQQSDFEGWFQYLANIGLDKDRTYVWTFEEQPRIGDDWRRLNTNTIRTFMTYNVDKHFGVSLGYMWGPQFYNSHYYHVYRDENRTFMQLSYKDDLWGMSWVHRFRQEQRFIENTAGSVSNRSRYLIRASYPLSDDKNFGLTGYNEIFVNLNSVYNGPTGGYDQDRIFVGPYWKVDNARYEVGFLEQHTQRFGLEPRWAQVLMFMASFDY